MSEQKEPKVTGIGGVFFYTDNLDETKKWYTENLGIEFNDWGSASLESLQWKPFKKESGHFDPSKKEFMVNYKVQNLEGLLEKFRANGVTILDDVAVYDFGKFVHILDAEGNKIELWEPVEK